MALFTRGEPTTLNLPAPVEPVRQSLVASAALEPMDNLSWRSYRLTDEVWQRECWRLYDITPELSFAVDYVSSACSRVRIYVGDIDEKGRPAGETENEEIQAVGDTIFGSPAGRSEALGAMGGNLTVAGECYIVGRAARDFDHDTWRVLSSAELRRRRGGIYADFGYGPEEIIQKRDLIIRLWTPHKAFPRLADSPTRHCLPVLRELEQLMKYEFSQIDSRLANGGLYFVPDGLTFPRDDGQPANGPEDLMELLTEAMSASLEDHGTAASLVPIIAEVPRDVLKDMPKELVKFESVLSDKIKDYREAAIRRIATGMNIPPEVLIGRGEMSHFALYHIEESTVKIHIEPLITRICDGLTRAYLRPWLKLNGFDPMRYQFWYDTAPLTVRPNRLQDTLNLYRDGIVSKEAVLKAGDYNPVTDAASDEETNIRFIKQIIERDPTLFQVPEIREAVGIDIDIKPPEIPVAEELAGPGPAAPPRPRTVPDTTGQPPALTKAVKQTPILASAAITGEVVDEPSAVLVAANAVAIRALELAGGRLLTPQYRGQWPGIGRHEIHTKLAISGERIPKLLDRAWDHLGDQFYGLDVDLPEMGEALHQYCSILLTRSTAHNPQFLGAFLRSKGLA